MPARRRPNCICCSATSAGRGARATADGVLTLASMLHPPAQREAASVFGVAATHAGILSHPLVLERVDGLLSGVPGD